MEKYFGKNCLYFLAVLTGLISFFGAAIYRLYRLNNIGIIISLALSGFCFIIILYKLKKKNHDYDYKLSPPQRDPAHYKLYYKVAGKYPKPERKKNGYLFFISILFYGLSFCLATYTLSKARAAFALISPWEVVSSHFFIFYGLATLILIFAIALFQPQKKIFLLLISLNCFLSLSVAVIVYKIGYGFDPFIHQATAALIDKIGAVYPKPFYYLGQYSLIIILHKITALPIVWLDKLLVPALAAILLPNAIFQFLKKCFSHDKVNLLLPLAILVLPFSFFIATTPQNLAYLFLFLAILYGLTVSERKELAIIYIFALASLACHPLAGLPALFFALTLTAYHSNKDRLKKYFYILVFIFSSLSLPLAFYFVNKNSGASDLAETATTSDILEKITIPGRENFILNFIYLYAFNLKTIIIILILSGLFIAYRNRQNCKIYFLNLIIAISLAVAYILTSRLPFNFLISYERSDYLERILSLIVIILLPFIIIPLYGLLEKILEQKKVVKIPLLIFLAILITTSLYLSYPRFDRYFNSHGYSTGQNDIATVNWIANDASGDYIVLANQQVSAAALREFGFSHYYPLDKGGEGNSGDIYFYPIPTGGALYQYYLDMVYKKPARDTMDAAMDLAGVKQSYFVLNKYWWAFPKILAEAKLEADSWTEIGDGEIYIFKYLK
ncbi:MAG: hypothetical protein PHZ04_02050 [Patescibacteria group bacterium]|nr:hypothetical protein [Patescibacteria group bacterium]MDD5294448.1 hypothetical protein [Patescibacteria group bacterium]